MYMFKICMTNELLFMRVLTFIIVLWRFPPIICQRRLVNGTLVLGEPKYLAYFIKTQATTMNTGLVCGGAIIHAYYILTSVTCLDDVGSVYAITGYNRYIRPEDIDSDECTRRIKKKVVSRSIQKACKPDYGNAKDLGLAKVESPYNFRDNAYMTYCSYAPSIIKVNFKGNFQLPGTEVVTFGWDPTTLAVSNNPTATDINYISTVIIENELCQKLLFGNTKRNVQNYTLCTTGQGSLDDRGKRVPISKIHNIISNRNIFTTTSFKNKKHLDLNQRNQLCQNDHGGPLITWIGGREYVIGVASGFLANNHNECVGPYIFSSTFSSGEFINCVLHKFSARRSRVCDMAPVKRGYEIIEEELS